MSAAGKKFEEFQTISTLYDLEAMSESISLLLPAMKVLNTEGDLTFVSKSKPFVHLFIASNLAELLCEILGHIEEGGDITLEPNSKTVSVSEASEILNVSIQYLNQQLEAGVIAFKTVNGQTQVEARSLFAFKRNFEKNSDECLENMMELTRELY